MKWMSDSELPLEDDASPLEAVESESVEPGQIPQDYPLPPASFEFFVLSMKAQAEMAMGLYNFGEDANRPKPDLRVARHSIDLLAMIAEKTKGNLSMDEQRLIENSLTELRFRYIQAVETSNKKS